MIRNCVSLSSAVAEASSCVLLFLSLYRCSPSLLRLHLPPSLIVRLPSSPSRRSSIPWLLSSPSLPPTSAFASPPLSFSLCRARFSSRDETMIAWISDHRYDNLPVFAREDKLLCDALRGLKSLENILYYGYFVQRICAHKVSHALFSLITRAPLCVTDHSTLFLHLAYYSFFFQLGRWPRAADDGHRWRREINDSWKEIRRLVKTFFHPCARESSAESMAIISFRRM